MKVVAIAAVADNGVIGSGQDMLWHISADFRRFKKVTMGHTLVFGRRTFEQIGKLPGRRHIICTHDRQWSADGVDAAASPREAVEMARDAGETICYIAGGGQIYADAGTVGATHPLGEDALQEVEVHLHLSGLPGGRRRPGRWLAPPGRDD